MINAPTPDFTLADYVVGSRADTLFKDLTCDSVEYTGDDQTIGWTVTKVEASQRDIAQRAGAIGDPWLTERRNVEPGYYLVKVNSDGTVWSYFYKNYTAWNEDYHAIEDAFDEWSEAIEDAESLNDQVRNHIDSGRAWGGE